MIILGIETSCDETAAAIVEAKAQLRNRAYAPAFKILSSIVSSQVDIHAKTGGIVPEVAAREHIKNMLPIIDQALKKAKLGPKKIDAIAVTAGPGLITSLLVGAETAKVLAYTWNKPLIAINHLAAHIYANFIENPNIEFPLLALVVSGGHTELVLMNKHLDFKVIGRTRDDAAGEAFDKVAKLLNIGYPGGPIISKLAKDGNRNAINFPRPMISENNFDFSFSGLKTAVLYEVQSKKYNLKDRKVIADFCASFEQAAIDVLVTKTIKAAKKYKVESVVLSGGVAANQSLRETMKNKITKAENLPANLLIPNSSLCTDNATMIAVAGYYYAKNKKFINWDKLEVDPTWELE